MSAGVLSAAMVETAVIAFRDVKNEHLLPVPGELAAVAIIFGLLALFPDSAKPFPAVVAWGFVVATFLNLWNPATPLNLIGKVATTPPTQGATP